MVEIHYRLTSYDGQPCNSKIEWLDENNHEKFNAHLLLAGQGSISEDVFRGFYKFARYCLLYHDGLPIARGAVEPISEQAWEASDIRTAKEYRGRGFAKETLRFLSRYIIENGKMATCYTEEDNIAMQKVIKSVGYKEDMQNG